MNIRYKDEAIKKLRKIGPNDRHKVKKKIESLGLNPFAGKPLQGQLKGLRSLRAWPLRIIYTIDTKSQTIIIETIDYRQSVYKK